MGLPQKDEGEEDKRNWTRMEEKRIKVMKNMKLSIYVPYKYISFLTFGQNTSWDAQWHTKDSFKD